MLRKFIQLLKILRIDFVVLAFIPFLFGYCIDYPKIKNFDYIDILLSLSAIFCFYLSFILFNESFDRRPEREWEKAKFFNSSIGDICDDHHLFSLRFYFAVATILAFFGVIGILILNLRLNRDFTHIWLIVIMFLAWAYQIVPPKINLSILSEFILLIFLGPILVLTGYFIKTGIIFSRKVFLLSLPFGFSILFPLICKKVTDYKRGGCLDTWHLLSVAIRKKAFYLYLFLTGILFLSLLVIYYFRLVQSYIFLGLIILFFIGVRIALILKNNHDNLKQLNKAFRLSIVQHYLLSAVMFIAILL